MITRLNNEILNRLLDIKQANHISVQDISNTARVSIYTINSQLCGKRALSLDVVYSFVLLVPTLNVRWLITGDGDKNIAPLDANIMPSLNAIQASLFRIENSQNILIKREK